MFKPEVIVMDYETALTDGTPSTEFYRHDFRVVSAAFSWFREDGTVKSIYREGETDVASFLRKIAEQEIPLVQHNVSFELGVTLCRFAWFPTSLMKYDTMRLAQVADNGGKDAQRNDGPKTLDEELAEALGEKSEARSGLGLQSVVSRWLPSEYHNHKEPFYRYLREEHGVKKGKEGANLHLLPAAMLEAYNVKDTEVTLLLWKKFTETFKAIGYDWRLDHTLYRSSAEQITKAKIRGVKVDREKLDQFRVKVDGEIEQIRQSFFDRFTAEIQEIEQTRLTEWVNGVKKEQAQANRWLAYVDRKEAAVDAVDFNPNSTSQLKELFVDKLGIKPTFWTKENWKAKKKRDANPKAKPFISKPSFRSSHLHTYGDGGKLLVNLKKRMIVLAQTKALLELSAYDGRFHPDLKACGTVTGRFAAGKSD